MAKNAFVMKRFDGGVSPDVQIGPPNSFAYGSHIDFRKSPSQLTVLPGPVREGAGIIVDLIQNTVMTLTGVIYALGDQGYVYSRSTAGVWTVVGKLTDGNFGLSYRSDVDKIFLTSSTTISEISPISNNPVIFVDKYAESASTYSGATLTGGVETYTVPTTLSELEKDKQAFTVDIEPISKIRVRVTTKGTGDWTLTVHDPLHNVLATSTVATASITSSAVLDFTFTTPPRLYVKPNARTYHFHLTSTVADGTVACATANDLNTCDFTVYGARLIDTRNGMHPIQTFLQYECIGNGNYLSVWEPLSDEPLNTEYLRHKLVFPSGLEVCGLAKYQEYLAIACEKRTDAGTSQDGVIFFWDGLSSTYNYFVSIPEGSPYSLHEYKDVLYYEAGGSWYAYAGGSPIKIRTMPGTDSEYSDTTDTTLTYPYMATVRRGVHLFGFPSSTTTTTLEHAVYSYGAANKDFSESFGLNYSISTGTRYNTGGSLRLGHVRNYGDTLLMSWRDGTDYGIDAVSNTADPATTAEFQSRWFDNNTPFKEKNGICVLVTFDPLPANISLTLKYRTQRGGAWTSSETFTSANTPRNQAKLIISPGRFYALQAGFDIVSTATTTPTITSVAIVFDDNRSEELA